ncbi:MAG: BamA/TamA family outer membrane protein [Tannerella sp.]|jgi:outer membrane protein insertion porin family|nr:BamA/TamA family outer membrane protein [Tannerella sp.]
MDKKTALLLTFIFFCFTGKSQVSENLLPTTDSVTDSTKRVQDTIPANEIPTIEYTFSQKKYKIDSIKVTGATNYEDYVLIGFSGLSKGDVVSIPGDEITEAVNRFWRQGLFSDVKILASRIFDGKVWLDIQLKPRPRIYEINFNGVKKSERTDLDARLNLRKGFQITPHVIDRTKTLIKKYFEDKGFKNVDIDVVEKPVPGKDGEVIVDVNIDKNEKTKIERIYFNGIDNLTAFQLRKAMKKTNEKFNMKERFRNSWLELFSTKKFTTTEYEADKKNLIDKYNEFGYRDAVILSDSVVPYDAKHVSIYLDISEGQKYYLKDIRFVGNTKYSSDYLGAVLNMKPGEVYNQKKLMERMMTDDDAVWNVYQNNGYMFSQLDPVEVDVMDDSIALEIRIIEGPQATINKVVINGNDRLYEDIIRRELRTKPGDLFSREALMRSLRELAQMGHFDPENMKPDASPNQENGTVDIIYNLASKANDQVEFSLGWGQTGLIGKLGLKFTNFSLKNLINPSTYKGIIPQGEGQTLNISGQTNAQYYQAYSISFLDPWFGGKRPNTLSLSAYFSRYTGINSSFYSQMQNAYLNSLYSNPYLYSGYGGYGYGSYYGTGSSYGYENYYESAYDKSKYMQILGFSVGYGKRLNWPDDYFNFMATLNYQMYMLSNWSSTYYLGISENGTYNDINLELALQRNSIDNPLYTRFGSQFTLTGAFTLPYSLWDGKDYKNITSEAEKFKFVEYYKITFKAKTFIPLLPLPQYDGPQRTPVLMSRVEVGWIGDYNKYKKSPFGTYYVGGDGMTGGYMYYQETVALRGYENGAISGNNPYMPASARSYSRLSMELRYPLILEPSSTIYGLGFIEAGNAWTSMSEFDPFNLKRSAGFGVRIFLPMIGLMGIDWGYGFDKPYGSSTRGGGQFHFILGQEF